MVEPTEQILCSAFDFYGKQLVNGTSDHRMQLYAYQDEWVLVHEWKAHNAPVYDCSFSHPYFGTLIASCSTHVNIWEYGTKVDMRCQLPETNEVVDSVAFAPQAVGLKLASACRDGIVRVYIPSELLSLSEWTCIEEIPFSTTLVDSCKMAYSPDEDRIVVVCQSTMHCYASMQNAMQKVVSVDVQDRLLCCAYAPTMGRTFDLVAVGSEEGRLYIFKVADGQAEDVGGEMLRGRITKVQWNLTGTVLFTTEDTKVTKWQQIGDKWQTVESIPLK